MHSESESSQAAPETEVSYKGSTIILSSIIGVAFFLAEGARGNQSNWANSFGNALACGLLSLVTGSTILLFFLGFPKNRRMLEVFASCLTIPLLLAGIFWLWRAQDVTAQAAEKTRYAQRVEAQLKNQEEQDRAKKALEAKADPVIRSAKRALDSSIRESIKARGGSISIDGWSASYLDGGKWLVMFQYSVDGIDKWYLYEYNDYLNDFRSVFSDKSLEAEYFQKSADGASFTESTRRKMGAWYGPIR